MTVLTQISEINNEMVGIRKEYQTIREEQKQFETKTDSEKCILVHRLQSLRKRIADINLRIDALKVEGESNA